MDSYVGEMPLVAPSPKLPPGAQPAGKATVTDTAPTRRRRARKQNAEASLKSEPVAASDKAESGGSGRSLRRLTGEYAQNGKEIRRERQLPTWRLRPSVIATSLQLTQRSGGAGGFESMTTQQLIEQLITEGGAIVMSDQCSEIELADAQSTGRFAVDDEWLGYVRRYKEWLAQRLSDTERLNWLEKAAWEDKRIGNGMVLWPYTVAATGERRFTLQDLGDEDGSNLGEELENGADIRACIDASRGVRMGGGGAEPQWDDASKQNAAATATPEDQSAGPRALGAVPPIGARLT